jgi:asparagine synthase (glutamine-hydrolysing)
MPSGLHALPGVPCAPDEERIAELLVHLPETGPRTFFSAIERVEPGCIVAVQEASVTARRHWNPRPRTIVFKQPQDYVDAARELLDQAVQCRLRGVGDVAAHLSGGLDSSGVAATAARLLAPSGRRVVAFTAVPRPGYPEQSGRITNEGPLAAATAAMYPNIEHVLITDLGRSLLDDLDRDFLLVQRPSWNLAGSWTLAINDAIRDRKLSVLLLGSFGNISLSYSGMALLPELLQRGRWIDWLRMIAALRARQGMTWPNLMGRSFGPWFPAAIWSWVHRVRHGKSHGVNTYSPINPRRFAELDMPARARATRTDLVYRPWKDGFAERLWTLGWADQGNPHAGLLAGWQIDRRDPTADVRLIEFCLGIPTEQFLYDGVPRALARRALADRLPRTVLDETRSGRQAADWHERLTAVRDRVAAQLRRFDSCPPAMRALDLKRLHRLVENWPTTGWERDEVIYAYRVVLLAGIGVGDFLWRASNDGVATLSS